MESDPSDEASRAEAEVEAMRTADDIIFYLPDDITRGLGLEYSNEYISVTMLKNKAECVKEKLESEEVLDPFDPDRTRVSNPKFGNDDYALEFYPVDDRFTAVIMGDLEPIDLFAILRRCIVGADDPSMPGGRKKTRKSRRKPRRKSKKTLRRR